MHKTQVFIAPVGDHYRTRLTHTLEVSQIARSIARALRLNEDLTEAIALGHDLGHTPFGHRGEQTLNEIHPGGFRHNEQSYRVVDVLEKRENKEYSGLNLSLEVLDGIVEHRSTGKPNTLEGQIIQFADRIAYINHDIDDAFRAGLLSPQSVPNTVQEVLGKTSSERIDRLIRDVIHTSQDQDSVRMSPDIYKAMLELRTFLFKNLYLDSRAKQEDEKADHLLRVLYRYFLDHPSKLPEEFLVNETDLNTAVKDYIAGMSDGFATQLYVELFVPRRWK